MRVLALSTWAKFSANQVEDLRQRLPGEQVEIVLVLVSRPAEQLAVTRCLVTGPLLRPGRRVRDFPFRGAGLSRLDRLDRALSRRVPGLGRDRRRMLASGVVRSAVVREEATAADLVIALDYNATWAAWKLARKVPGPAVVFQPEGVVRRLTDPRE
jgi:hypothetical protein